MKCEFILFVPDEPADILIMSYNGQCSEQSAEDDPFDHDRIGFRYTPVKTEQLIQSKNGKGGKVSDHQCDGSYRHILGDQHHNGKKKSPFPL